LVGGNGNDAMRGGTGNDTYVVDQAGDLADETGGDGIDTILSTITRDLNNTNHAIGDIENITLVGTGNAAARGSALDNVLTGNAGDNLLIGRNGDDVLSGMGGNDD